MPTGTAWSGEFSYRPNAPVQLNTTDILYAGVTPLGRPGAGNASPLNGAPGQDLHGYRRKEITQFQTTFTHFFDQVMGASRLTLVGEVGVTHVGGLESKSTKRVTAVTLSLVQVRCRLCCNALNTATASRGRSWPDAQQPDHQLQQ